MAGGRRLPLRHTHAELLLSREVVQAAAEREHGPFHPMLGSPSVCAFLRRQRAVKQSLLSAADPQRPVLDPGARTGCTSTDFMRYAVLSPGNGNKLHVRDAFTGELQERDLPQGPTNFMPAADWGWDSTGRLTLLFGGAWNTDSHSGCATGMVHLDVGTGSAAVTVLPLTGHASDWWATADFCPGCSRVLVQYACKAAHSTFFSSIFDSRGTLLRTLGAETGIYHPLWAPSGQALAMSTLRAGGVHVQILWDLSAGSLAGAEAIQVTFLAWATPFSQRAALILPGETQHNPQLHKCMAISQAGQPLRNLHITRLSGGAWSVGFKACANGSAQCATPVLCQRGCSGNRARCGPC